MAEIKPQSAERQITFHALLVDARRKWLIDALSDALATVDPNQLKSELGTYASVEAQQALAVAGIRDEHVFPTPVVLKAAPMLVGYYRLLLGVPQKTFYGTGSGMQQFKTMESKGTINARQEAALPEFCTVMGKALAELVLGVSPSITPRDVNELPLLTIGSFFQGGNNNLIGQAVTESLFEALTELLAGHITKTEPTRLTIQTEAGKTFFFTAASDPDLTIEEKTGGANRRVVAIEIKGGTDKSNAHNRAGEAEKSHLKAKEKGFEHCWTIFHTSGLDMVVLRSESPSTERWFDTGQLVAREGESWDAMQQAVREVMGI